MPRIRCNYEGCIHLEGNFCTAGEIELDQELGCLTFSQVEEEVEDEIETIEEEEEWEDVEEDEEDEDWDDLDEEEEDDDWDDDEDSSSSWGATPRRRR